MTVTAPQFFEALQTAAVDCQITRGKLLRIVLPFSEETSSSDQSEVLANFKNPYFPF